MLEQRQLESGEARQRLALTGEHYFSSNAKLFFRFDTERKLLEEKRIHVEGVNHNGAIDYHESFLWAGFLRGPVGGEKLVPKLNRSIIVKVDPQNLTIIQTWDITKDLTWITPVCFDETYLWVSDLGIHRYCINDQELVRDSVFRYPPLMHFSQGIHVVGRKLYTIHTFGDMDGLFEFESPEQLTDEIQ